MNEAKQKAISLLEKFELETDFSYDGGYEFYNLNTSERKHLANIACDEILDCLVQFGSLANNVKDFYREVKIEIDKL